MARTGYGEWSMTAIRVIRAAMLSFMVLLFSIVIVSQEMTDDDDDYVCLDEEDDDNNMLCLYLHLCDEEEEFL